MDQLRTLLAWLKQQHFWVLSVLVALIGIVCWWSAARTLSAQYEDNQRKITTEFQNLTTLRSDPFHPNDDINRKQVEETSKLAEQVAELWDKLYELQREKVLKWPRGRGELSAQFSEYVEKLEFGETIPDNLREEYQNYIYNHFPELPKKIGARPIDLDAVGTRGGAGIRRGGRGESRGEGGIALNADGQLEEDNSICEWLDEDQAVVREELEFRQQPSSLRIWWTQENLWVYHTLLNVIKNTNDAAGASRMSNAAVRTVFSLQVGKRAAQDSRTPDRIYKLPLPAGATADASQGEFGPAGQEAQTGEMREQEFSGGFAEGGPQTEAQDAAMFSNRYLDEAGKPIPAGAAPTAEDPSAGATPIDPASFGKEYKRLPIRMVLEMDQRHLPRLIAECAVQPLQVEVQEVRINVPDAIGGQGGGLSALRGGFGEGGGSPFPELTGPQSFPSQPHIVTVVIQGVIYIFNKPDLEFLKTTTEDEPELALR